jgi:hypothetical protein
VPVSIAPEQGWLDASRHPASKSLVDDKDQDVKIVSREA